MSKNVTDFEGARLFMEQRKANDDLTYYAAKLTERLDTSTFRINSVKDFETALKLRETILGRDTFVEKQRIDMDLRVKGAVKLVFDDAESADA